ncbi:hypothetical protein BT69DRAFT_1379451, partial [Atractiella rhizophila]
MTEQETSTLLQNTQGPDLIALAHLITPATLIDGTPIHLSILPSFFTCLPPSIHALRVTLVLPPPFSIPLRFWMSTYGPSKLSYFSIEGLESAIESDGVINLCVTLDEKSVTVTFGDAKHHLSVYSDNLPFADPFTFKFYFLPEHHSQVTFVPVALYSNEERCFVPLTERKSSIPSSRLGTIIQLSCSLAPTLGITPSTISQLPIELLSLIFEFLVLSKYKIHDIEDLNDKNLVSFTRVSAVCRLWRTVSAPYWEKPDSVEELHARLKRYPNAGHLWNVLLLEKAISAEMVKEVILGSPNVTRVRAEALWNEEDAKIVLNSIASLRRVHLLILTEGLRKWKKEEVENIVQRVKGVRYFTASTVEESSASSPISAGLQLPAGLISLYLSNYPALPSLSFPHSLRELTLHNVCPLPPTISSS